jgi:hypothetical protein
MFLPRLSESSCLTFLRPDFGKRSEKLAVVALVLASLVAGRVHAEARPGADSAPRSVSAAQAQRLSQLQVPLRFEANAGQPAGGHAKSVRYVGRGPGYNLRLGPASVAVDLAAAAKAGDGAAKSAALGATKGETLRLTLEGANPDAAITAEDRLPGIDSYFTGSDMRNWRTGLATYGRVAYREVYPGVDLAFYGHDSRLEYDFIVKPGADAARVRFDLGGMKSAGVDAEGDLRLETGSREMKLLKPVAYQLAADGRTRQLVEAKYRLRHGKAVGFELGAYDHGRALVIDPVLAYSTYLPNWSYAIDVQVDASGNIYVLTWSLYSTFDVLKFNAAGTMVYDATFTCASGSGNFMAPMELRLDSTGRAFVAGYAQTGYPTTASAYQSTYPNAANGQFNATLSVVSADGSSLAYSTYFGGVANPGYGADEGIALAVDAAGNAYMAGMAQGQNFPVTTGAYQTAYASNSNNAASFVAKFNPSLSGAASLVYSTLLGQGGYSQGLAVDAAGDAFVSTGSYQYASYPVTTGAYSYGGSYGYGVENAYVTEVNPTGTGLVYSAYLGPASPTAIALDASGDAYVTGLVLANDFPTTAGAYQTTYPDGFVTELNPSGSTLIYSTFLSGPSGASLQQTVQPGSIALAPGCVSACAVYVSGDTSAADLPAVNAIQAHAGALNSAFAIELAGNGGSALFSSYLGGLTSPSGEPYAQTGYGAYHPTPHVAVDGAGNFYLAGNSYITDFPVLGGVGSNSNGTYLAKIAAANAGALVASTTSVAFGSVPVGISSTVAGTPVSVTLRNLGSAGITLQPFAFSPPGLFTETDTCAGQIAAGSYCTLQLAYTPTVNGAQAATLTVSSTASNGAVTIALGGTGVSGAYVVATPSSLAFPNQTVSTTSAVQTVTVKNIGNAAASLSSIYAGNGTPGAFPFGTNCGALLNPGQSCQVGVQFAPLGTGQVYTYIYGFGTGNVQGGLGVSGNGVTSATNGAGVDAISPASINFNTQVVGTASATQSLYFYNTGTVPMTINSVTAALTSSQGSVNDFQITYPDYNYYYNQCSAPPFQLAPQTYCYAYVTFTPSVAATETATVTITDTTGGSAHTVTLGGTGLAAAQVLEFMPGNQVFPDQPVGIASGAQTFTVYNQGNSPFTISRVLAAGDFSAVNTGNACANKTLAPPTTPGGYGGSCTVSVVFTPTATGARTGTITLVDPASGNPQVLNVMGNGITAAGVLTVSPTKLQFAAQPLGVSSTQQPVTVANNGTVALTVNSITPAGDYAYTDASCGATPFTVAPGATCYGNVTFTPTSATANPRTGSLTYASTAGNQTVTLTGTGEAATQALAFTPATVSFGNVPHGTVSSYPYTGGQVIYLRNTGTETITFSASVTVTSPFQIYSDGCTGAGATLAAGASCPIYLNFQPTAISSYTGTMTVKSSAGTQTLSLAGSGVAAASAIMNAQPVAFNTQPVGTSSSAAGYYYVTLENYGTSQVITIASAAISSGSSNFTILSDSCTSQPISPGSYCVMAVAFNPTAAGYLTGALTFTDTSNKTYTSTLTGYAPADSDSAQLSPAGVNFGSAVVGASVGYPYGLYTEITLTNTGDTALTVGSLTGTNFGSGKEFPIDTQYAGDACSGATLSPGATCTIGLDFAPSAAGARSGTVVFPVTYADGTTGSYTATVAGTGVTAKNSAVLSPTAETFLDQAVGTVSGYYTGNYGALTLTNTGNLPLTVGTVSGTNFGAGSEFPEDATLGADGCSGQPLAAGQTCYVYVDFAPKSTGKRTGTVNFPVIYASGSKATLSATLSGNGIAATSQAYVSPSGLVFAGVSVGSYNGSSAISLINSGNQTLTVGAVNGTNLTKGTSGADFTFNAAYGGYDGCSAQTLTPGTSCPVYVVFKPTAAGARTGTINFPVTYAGTTTAVTLSGTLSGQGASVAQTVALSQSSITFPATQLGIASAAAPISISNQSSSYIYPGFTFSGTAAGDYSQNGNCGSVAPASSCTFTVTFTPTATGTRAATLTENDSFGNHAIALTGTGTKDQGVIVLYPSSLAFSSTQTLGVGSEPLSFSVTNNGTVAVTVSKVASSDAAEFPVVSDGCTGTTLSPGQNCTVSVTFLPSATGARSATITITDNAPTPTQTLAVTGGGSANIGSTVTLSAAPQSAAVDALVTLTATVQDTHGNAVSNGAVTFYDGATVLGAAQVVATNAAGGVVGTATLRTRALPQGSNSITAKYAGADQPGTAAAIAVTITGSYPTSTLLASTGTQGNYVLTGTVTGLGPWTPNPTGNVIFTDNQTNTTLGTVALSTTTAAGGLVTAGQPAVGGTPTQIAAGDLNGDGNLDLAVANYGDSTVSILLGNGDGTYKPQTVLGYSAYSVTFGDFNGDGRLDIAAFNASNMVTVAMGNGDGTFGEPVQYTTTTGYNQGWTGNVVAADVNGDGILDLITPNWTLNSISILLGDGDGSFEEPITVPTGAEPTWVNLTDLNGDGIADLTVSFQACNCIAEMLGNGDGSFGTATNYTIGNQPYAWSASFSIADVNGDGKPDVVAPDYAYGTLTVLPGKGNGTFGTGVVSTLLGNPLFTAVGDINGDGKPDAVTTADNQSILVSLGNGDGTFQAPTSLSASINTDDGRMVLLADLNHDGKLDVAAIPDRSVPAIQVWLGQLAETATLTGVTLPGSIADNVTAAYQGDTHYASSVSNALNLGSNAGRGSIKLTATPASGALGAKITLVATVSDPYSNPIPGGTVTFASGTQTLGTVSIVSSGTALGTATLVTRSLPAGTNTVTATFNGTANYLASLPASTSVTITGLYPTATTLTASGTQGSYLLSAAVNAFGLGTPSGSVVFTDATTSTTLGTAPITAAGVQPRFVLKSTPATGQSPQQVVSGDFNGDGKLDLAVGNYYNTMVTVLLGNGDGTFTAQPAFGTNYSGAYSIAAGDFNGDGKLDIATGNGPNVGIFLGNGDGTFGAETDYTVANGQTYSLVVGDLNGDGKADLISANGGAGTLSVLLGNGNGTFQTHQDYAVGSNPAWVVAGDFNKDGKLDVASANFSSSTLSVLLGNGDGTLQSQQVFTAGNNPNGLAVGDYNGDGKLDLAVANDGDNTVGVLLGNGDGTFQAQTTYPVGSEPGTVWTADVNGDGKLDLVESSYGDGTLGVLLGNGDGTFQSRFTTPGGSEISDVAVGDFNGDGRLDLAATSFNGNIVTVVLGDAGETVSISGITLPGTGMDTVVASYTGDGAFAASTSNTLTLASHPLGTTTALTATPASGALGTVFTLTATVTDANSRPVTGGTVTFYRGTVSLGSISVVSQTSGTTLVGTAKLVTRSMPAGTDSLTAVYSGDGSDAGSTSAAVPVTVTGTVATKTSVVVAGTAGNYKLTATVAGPSPLTPTGTVTFNDTTSNGVIGTAMLSASTLSDSFSVASGPAVGSDPGGARAGDFNGDGIQDLAVSNDVSATVSILLGKGDGTFQPQVAYSTVNSPNDVAVADLNGDGKLDLVTANGSNATVSVLLGNGDGTFQSATTYTSVGAPGSLAIGDVNGDGRQDVVIADYSGDQIEVLLGAGDGTLHASSNSLFATGTTPRWQIALADVNGDGKLDVVTPNVTDSTVSVLLGNGDGTFQTQQVFTTGVNPEGVAVGDFNGDGKPDLAVADASQSAVSVLLGNGDGTFLAHTDYTVGNSPITVVPGDYNGDGKLDIAVPNYADNTVSVLLGNGDGTFKTKQTYQTSTEPGYLFGGDFNGDGLPDLVSVNQSTNTVTVLLDAITAGATLSGASVYGGSLHTANAVYGGDPNFAGSTSASYSLTAVQVAPTITLTPTPSASVVYGTTVSVKILVSGPANAPNGTGGVTYTLDGGTAQAATLSSGAVTVTLPTLAIGNHTFAVSYAGNTVYTSGTQSLTIAVTHSQQTITFPAIATMAYGAGSFGVNPTSTSGLAVTVKVISGPATVASNVVTLTGAGTVVLEADQAGDSNYAAAAPVQVSFSVIPAVLTIAANNTNKVYGTANPALTAKFTGLVGTDTVPVTCTTTATTTSPVGTYPITCALNATAPNYTVTLTAGTLTINKMPLTVVVASTSKVYGAALPTLTGTITGLLAGDSVTAAYATTATATSAKGGYVITATLSGSSLGNYTPTITNGTLTVTAAPLTITVNNASRLYGGANPSLTGTITGVLFSDVVAATYTTTATATSPAGTYPITVSALTGAASGNYSIATLNPGVLTVSQAPLTVNVMSLSKVYGSANPSFTGTITGTENGDTITATYSTTALQYSSVGSYPITAVLAGSALSNYSVTINAGTLTVTQAILTIKVGNASRYYGAANPAFTGMVTGILNNDNVVVTYATPATVTSNAGTYTITASVSGTAAGNYNPTITAGTLTVNPAPLTVVVQPSARVYGAANPSFAATFTGLVNGDTLTPTFSTAATAASAVGSYPVTATLAGTALPNYAPTITAGTLTITQAPLTVTVANAAKTYGAANPVLTGTINGAVNGDTITAAYATTATAASAAGTYPITATLSGTALPNYAVTNTPGVLTVNAAVLTVTAANQTMNYGGTLPSLTYSFTGFVNGDTASVVSGTASLSTTAVATSPAGSYPITAAQGTLAASNYSFAFVNGTLTVAKAPLTATVSPSTKVYGSANPQFTVAYTGLANGDVLTPAFNTTATATSGVGSYTVTVTLTGAALSNYTLTTMPGTLTITKAPLTVTGATETMVYGSALPALTYTVTGFVNTDTRTSSTTGVPSLTTAATSATPVGSFAIKLATGTLASTNYSFTLVNGTLTITQAPLSVVVANATRNYGVANPQFTGTITGAVNSDTITPTYSTTATTTSVPGTYPITVTLAGAHITSYAPVITPGTLTVTKLNAVVSWSTPAPITYGTALGSAQLNATATLNGTALPGTFSYTPAAGTVLKAGAQTLSVTFTPTNSADYAPITQTVTLTVNPAAPVLTWATPAPIAYGAALSATQLNATAAFGGQSVPGTFTYSPVLGTVLKAGAQTLSVSFAPTDSADFTAATATVQLTVNPGTPTITWATPPAITYGTALSTTQLNAKSSIAGSFTYTPAVGAVLAAGTQTLSATFTPTDAVDYAPATATVTLVVNQATPTAKWIAPAAIPYGTALGSTQLDPTATVPGSFTFTPAAGTVLTVGTQTLSAVFTPTDAVDYASVTVKTSIVVSKGAPAVTWPAPASIAYGTPLSATQLDATASFNGTALAGTYTYSPIAGTVLKVGTQTLSVTFKATDTTDFNAVYTTVPLVVTKSTPVVKWTAPAAIAYGTKLSATQLNATAVNANGVSVAGTFTYSPALGTLLTAGTQTLNVTFTPTDTTDYGSATGSVALQVTQGKPTLTWTAPTAITYGTALSATQLDAKASVAGSFTYTPAVGAVLAAGTQTLTATFTPTDAVDYSTATTTVSLVVKAAAPKLTWTAPAAITYGTALSTTQLNATAAFNSVTVPGTFTYTPAAGTVLTVGTQALSVTFTPTDATDFATATAASSIVVRKAAPVITWATPAAIPYGQPLDATELNATATFNGVAVPGTFTYSEPAGTLPAVGSHLVTVAFAPTDTVDYASASGSATITVVQATPTINWPTPAAIGYGTALSATQLNATVTNAGGTTVAGTLTYSPALGTLLTAGTHTLSVSFKPTATTNYTTVTATVTLVVNQDTPTVTVSTPLTAAYGVPLNSMPFNPTATYNGVAVPGAFAYSTSASAPLPVGNYSVTVTFTPNDTLDYTAVTQLAAVTVAPATPAITWPTPASIVYGAKLSATQLNATAAGYTGAALPGTFTYSPAINTLLKAGTQTLSVTFKPTDTKDYATTTVTTQIVVAQATPVVTWATPAPITYGTALISTQQNATANVAGTFAYTPAHGTVLPVGQQVLTVIFTPTDTTDYTTQTASVTLTVKQAQPVITWATPAAITAGTALSTKQLDAKATFNGIAVAGTYTYTPALGTVESTTGTVPLSVTFTPTDTVDYATATGTVNLTVQ